MLIQQWKQVHQFKSSQTGSFFGCQSIEKRMLLLNNVFSMCWFEFKQCMTVTGVYYGQSPAVEKVRINILN